jgi:hypothetical protein
VAAEPAFSPGLFEASHNHTEAFEQHNLALWTPMLVGGPQQMMVATLISQQVRELLNWPFSGALVGFLLAVTLVLVLAFNRAVRLERFVGAR